MTARYLMSLRSQPYTADTANHRKVCVPVFALVFTLVCLCTVVTTSNVGAADLQSLLVVLDGSGLRIEKQLGAKPSGQLSPEHEKLRYVLRQNARNGSSSAKLSGLPEYPLARWYSANGEWLASTRFNDPRVLRAPQRGSLIHEAIVAKSVSRFLLRGPEEAASVEIFLPDISGALEVAAPTAQPTLTGTNAAGTASPVGSGLQTRSNSTRNSSGEVVGTTNWSEQQLWSLDL